MHTLETIKHHIASIPVGEIFTTRQMLKYGERKKIDLALSQLVKEGKIRRLSYGVFCLAKVIPQIVPSQLEVVLAKSDQNSHVVIDVEPEPNLKDDIFERIFYTDKKAGAFTSQGERIILKKICGRKYKLSQSNIGRILLAMWMTGKRTVDAQMVHDLIDPMSKHEKMQLRNFLELIPGWLHQLLLAEIVRQGF